MVNTSDLVIKNRNLVGRDQNRQMPWFPPIRGLEGIQCATSEPVVMSGTNLPTLISATFLKTVHLCPWNWILRNCVWIGSLYKFSTGWKLLLEGYDRFVNDSTGKYHYNKDLACPEYGLQTSESRCLETTTLERCAKVLIRGYDPGQNGNGPDERKLWGALQEKQAKKKPATCLC